MGKKKGSASAAGNAAAASPPAADATSAPAAAASSPAQETTTSSVLPTVLTDEKEFVGAFPCPFWPLQVVIATVALFVLVTSCYRAYTIRMFTVEQYGYLIHEFDPWFNYRATEYMSTHGWSAFFSWFDYMSWYPLGRPVGSTTYPGLQFTAVAIHRTLAAAGIEMSINDVCVLMPAWFGAIATVLLSLCTYEVSGSLLESAIAAFSFAVVPAHLMRSMAGEFDNECIAVAAMVLTFYLWVRSLRTPRSWPIGLLTGIAYGYMVAAWGGFTFVLNMVALHAGTAALMDWARNTYNPALLRAYALFYVVGTAIATRVPPVGMSPFKSLEQLGALVVLAVLAGLHVCEVLRLRADVPVLSRDNLRIRVRVFGVMAGAAALGIAVLAPTGYFGPLTARVRALFVAHTRTGNPLVDSVAEHRKTSPEAYDYFLDYTSALWLVGTLVQSLLALMSNHREAKVFMVLYSLTTYYFADRMSRLMVLAGPAASAMAAGLLGLIYEWCWTQLTAWAAPTPAPAAEGDEHATPVNDLTANIKQAFKSIKAAMDAVPLVVRSGVALVILAATLGTPTIYEFQARCEQSAYEFANPRLMFQTRLRNGEVVMIKDYPEAYDWLRRQTPQDARVLAWWDYGYQITGIGNRTSLADGNTWNHEHIATIGKMLTSPVAEAHSLVRHMADYVLIWAGQNGDLGKSPHMARIGNSVYRDICPNDPLCRHFGFYDQNYLKPTPTMRASLLYNLHEHRRTQGVEVNPSLFQEVYTSKYGLVRIFKVMNVSKESKKWIADPANRVCNPPGSWICPGQYPPAPEIQAMLAHRVDFEQLENFNRKKKDGSYHEKYLRQMRNRDDES